jgi:hypothetical protein
MTQTLLLIIAVGTGRVHLSPQVNISTVIVARSSKLSLIVDLRGSHTAELPISAFACASLHKRPDEDSLAAVQV